MYLIPNIPTFKKTSANACKKVLCKAGLLTLFFLITSAAFGQTWTGTVSNNWFATGNWSTGVVPTASTNVTIPVVAANRSYPLISTGTAVARNISISSGASFNMSGGTLNLSGSWTNAGTFNATGGTVNFTVNSAGSFATGTNNFFNVGISNGVDPGFDNNASSRMNVAGNFTNSNTTLGAQSNNFTLTFNGTGAQSYTNANTTNNIAGIVIINKTAGTLTLASTLRGGTFTHTAGGFTTAGNSLITSGNVAFNGGTATLTGSTINVTGTFTLAGGAITGGNTLTVSSNFTSTSGSFSAATCAVSIGGNWVNNNATALTFASVTFTGVGRTISGSVQTVFPAVIFTTGTVTLNQSASCSSITFANTAAANSLTVSSGVTLTVNGNVTINQNTGGTGYTHALNVNAGTVLVTGNITFSVLTNTNNARTNVTITTGTLTVNGNISMTNTQLAANSSIVMSSTGTLNLKGNFSVANLGTLTPGTTSTFVYNGTGSQTIASTGSGSTTISYANLTINKASGTASTTVGLRVLNLTVTAGTLNFGSDMNIAGNFVNNGTVSGAPAVTFSGIAKTISGASSTTFGVVTFATAATNTVSSTITMSSLTITPAGSNTSFTQTATGNVTVNGNVSIGQPTANNIVAAWNVNTGTATVNGNITIGAPTSTTASRVARLVITSGTVNANGDLIFNSNAASAATAVLLMSGGAGTANLKGAGILANGSGTLTPGTTSTVNFNGTAAQTFGISSAISYNNIHINNTAGVALLTDLTAASFKGDLRIQSGTFKNGGFAIGMSTGKTLEVVNGATLELSGTQGMVTGTTITKTFGETSTVNYLGGAQTVSAENYGHLIFSGTGGVVTKTLPAATFTVKGNFTSTVGTATAVNYTALGIINFLGNVNIGTSTAFSAGSFTHPVYGNWTNNGTFTGGTSTIIMEGANTSITSTNALAVHNYNNLTFSATGITSSISAISVAGNLASPDGAFTHTVGTLTMSGASKTISGVGITLNNLTISGTVSSTSDFTLAGNLTVGAGATLTTTAGKLTMSGAAKVLTATGTVTLNDLTVTGSVTTASNFRINSLLEVSGSFTASAGTATFGNTSTLLGTANLYNVTINGTSLQLAADAVLGIANVFAITAGTLNVTTTTPNTVNYNGSGAQSVIAGTYHHLTLSTGGTKAVAGSLTINGDLTIGSSAILAASTFTHTLYGNWINSGTFTPSTGTIVFAGEDDVTLTGATTFATLTINKSVSTNTVTFANNVTASTVAMTSGKILTGNNTLTITTTRTGPGIILGTIQRTHSFVAGTAYQFEGPDNTITFTAPSGITSVSVKVTSGSVADFPFGGSVNREYTITIPNGTYTSAALRLHYEDVELNGNAEATMQFWKYSGSWAIAGKTGNDPIANYVEHTTLASITGRWTFSDDNNVIRWNGGTSTDWFTAANWTAVQGSPAGVPSVNDIVQIGTANFTNQPSINAAAIVKSIELGSAKASTITLAAGGSLTVQGNISGTWSANATHTLNADAQTVTINGNLLLSDGTAGHAINLLISTGTVMVSGSLTQSGGASITFSGSGNLAIGGDYTYTSGTLTPSSGTVTYNGSGAQTVAPVTYGNLTINKPSGIATINSATNLSGNLTVTAGQLVLAAATTIGGNVSIASGAILNGGSLVTSVGGNWSNAGTFTPSAGTVSFNGSGSQSISASPFNNFTVNKASGTATLAGNVTVAGNLTINAGTLDISIFTANRSSSGGTLTIANGAALTIAGTSFPSNYTTYALGATSTVTYNGTGSQTAAGITYGNLVFSNGGATAKTLGAATTVNGNLTISSGATFSTTSQTLTLFGNWTNSGSFLGSTGTVSLRGTAKTVTGSTTFNTMQVVGSYSVSAGTNITVLGATSILVGGSLAGGTGTVTFIGNLTDAGTYSSTGTTTFSGTAAQAIQVTGAALNLNVVNFNGTVAPTLTMSLSPTYATANINNTAGITPGIGWTVTTALNVANGSAFSAGTYTHNFGGAFTNNGSVTSSGTLNFTATTAQTIKLSGTAFTSTGTLNFAGSGALSVTGTPTTLTNIIIANTTGVTPAANWTVSNNFTISSGAVFNAGTATYTVAGTLNSDGTLNGGTSTFNLSGATTTLSGSPATTFYDLLISGTVTAEDDYAVSRNFTVNGSYDGTAAILKMNGSAGATISGSAVTINIANLLIQKTGSAVVTLAHAIAGVQQLHINTGILDAATYSIAQVGTNDGELTVDAGATLRLGSTNTLPAFSVYNLDVTSTIQYNGGTQVISAAADYGNLLISAAGAKTVTANFNVLGNFTLTNGTFTPGARTISLSGNWTMSGGTFTNANSTIYFNGGADQTVTSTGAFNNITIDKVAGNVVLGTDMTVAGVTQFVSNNIQTDNYKLILPNGASISGDDQATGWVNGNLQKYISTTTATFEIGGPNYYAPVSMIFASLTTAGYLIAKATGAYHPNIATSGLNSYIQRYWTLSKPGAGAVAYTTATITFNWNTDDNYSPMDPLLEEVARYNSGTWTFPTLAGTSTTTSITITGLASLGDFTVGEKCSVATGFSYSGTPYCSNGGIATVTLVSGASLGSFTALPGGLTLDDATGEVTLATSTPGTYTVTNTNSGIGGCIATSTATITITAAPSAAISYADNPLCTTNSTASVTHTGTTGGTYSASSPLLSINSATGQINITASTAGTYTITYSVAAANGCAQLQVNTSVTINTAGTWTGASSSDWNTAGNWSCGGVPTATTNAVIPTGLTTYPQLTSGTGTVNNITLQSGATLTISATLQVKGAITNSGTLNAASGTLDFNGNTPQTIAAGTFSNNTIKGLIINNTSGVILGGTLNLTDVLTISNGSIITNDHLVLKSSATGTARVAQITSNSATIISGRVTVERYIQGRRKYRLMTSPVTTSPLNTLGAGQENLSIWGAWQNSGNNVAGNAGTIITGGTNGDGFDQQTTNASLFTYDDVNRLYVGYTTTNGKNTKYTPLKAGIAYYMFVYGDRLNAVNAATPNSTILSAKGALLTGDQSYTTASGIPLSGVTDRYTLLGNPFASPIDWTSLPKTNLYSTYWGWDPNLSSTGGYVTVNSTGNITLISPFTGTMGLNQYIQSGQGFFVRTSGANPTLTIREQDKVSDYNPNAFRLTSNNIPLMAVNLFYTAGTTKTMADGAVIGFDPSFRKGVAREDAAKLFGAAEIMGLSNGTEVLSIDGRPLPQNTDTIQLYSGKLTRSQYVLQIFASEMATAAVQPYLEDRYLKTIAPLALNDTNWIAFEVTANVAASSDTGRFRIIFKPTVLAGVSVNLTGQKQGGQVALQWTISSENNLNRFAVERSVDGVTFQSIGTLPATSAPAYTFTDVAPFSGKNYYRLRPVYRDSSSFTSNLLLFHMETKTPVVTVAPNPVRGSGFTLRVTDLPPGTHKLQLYSADGRLVMHRSITHIGGLFTQFIDLGQKMSAGIYYLQVFSLSEVYRQQIFIE